MGKSSCSSLMTSALTVVCVEMRLKNYKTEVKTMDKFEKKSIQYIINDVLADIHKERGETLCKFHACDKCGYCANEFNC